MDPSQSCWGLRDSGSGILASLITLALNPVAGMNLNTHQAVGMGQREGSGAARQLVAARVWSRLAALIKANVLSGTYHRPDIACGHIAIPNTTP